MALIETHVAEGIGTLTLNYSIKRNTLSEAMIGEMSRALTNLQKDGIRVLILRAYPGAKVWSAGHNVQELPLGGHDPLGWKDPLRQIIREIECFPTPVIALIEGSVWGGACELVFACDLIVATADATFAATPAKLGVPYNASGLLTFMNAATPQIAKEMLFTGRPIAAARLERQGIVNHVLPKEEIESFVHALARDICHNSPLSIAVMKEQMRILSGAHTLSPADFERMQGLRRVVYNSNDYQEGIRAFKEKRKPLFRGE